MFSLNPNTWIVILTNVIFFIIVQTLFFVFIASKQVDNVIEDKVAIIKTFASYNDTINDKITEFLNSKKRNIVENNAEKQKHKRNRYNLSLIQKRVGIPLIIATIALGIFIYKMYKKDTLLWNNTDTLALVLVLLAYMTELFMYFAVIKCYVFVGDYDILSTLLTEIFTYIKSKIVE